jgi:hypothetical protein
MRKTIGLVLVALGLLIVFLTSPTEAGGKRHGHSTVRTHVFVGVGGPYWWRPWRPYWAYYPYYYPPYAYYPYYPLPPVVVREEPPVYIQQQPPPAPVQEEGYWYYCQSAKEYYPTVAQCPEPWIKVPPRTP